MPINFALFLLALSSQSADGPGLFIATDKDLGTSVRLVETTDAVRFEFTGPEAVAPSVAIDMNRNGAIDRNVDFQVGRQPDGKACLQLLLHEGASSTCKQLGAKASISRSGHSDGTITTITFPKSEISGDGFGFGFAINLWSVTGDYGNLLASGDYRFGGQLSPVPDGPNFKGEKDYDVPPQILPAIHRYEGCLSRSLRALEPLDKSRIREMEAIPAGCAADRATALKEAVTALVESGVDRDEAEKGMSQTLDQMDLTISRMIKIVEDPGRSGTAPR